MVAEQFDKVIIGAGLYGLYSALFCCERGQKVVVLECDPAPFKRATFINQARVHQGYHYPRSISTAMKSAGYFALIGNLTRYTPPQVCIHGQMENSLRTFAELRISHVKNCIPETTSKVVCVMVYFVHVNIRMMQCY